VNPPPGVTIPDTCPVMVPPDAIPPPLQAGTERCNVLVKLPVTLPPEVVSDVKSCCNGTVTVPEFVTGVGLQASVNCC